MDPRAHRGRRDTPSRRTTFIAVLLSCLAIACIPAACGSQKPHLPDVASTFENGPAKHQVTIGLSSTGEGYGVADLTLTYPDGHSRAIGNAVLEDGVSTSWGPSELEPGHYGYTVYAIATATPSKDPRFPAAARTDANILRSGEFDIR